MPRVLHPDGRNAFRDLAFSSFFLVHDGCGPVADSLSYERMPVASEAFDGHEKSPRSDLPGVAADLTDRDPEVV